MPESRPIENDFLRKITNIIKENISNEQFGVTELADEIGMSHSNLLRKIKKLTDLSASQFIREVRLKNAMEMLRNSSSNVSEVSYNVGFGSTSYFIKCFREHYGYQPGDVGKRSFTEDDIKAVEHTANSHQLAAIMFTDIEGYTSLMQEDERKAVLYRNRHRLVFNSITEKYKGKILQYYGDGTLSTFGSAIDAVRCGIDLQMAFQEDPMIPVRIGIHSGDIIFTKDDIIGDGVNVASRVESLACSGSVCISEKVFDEVKNQTGIQTKLLGEFAFKNVTKPMEVFAISNPGLEIPDRDQINAKIKGESSKSLENQKSDGRRSRIKWIFILAAAILAGYLAYSIVLSIVNKQQSNDSDQSSAKKSIAVLPFINDSDDSTNVYIINGLMESILNKLQKIENLRVVSRTSVEKYRNNPKLIPEMAEELNVKYFVEGSGQKIRDQIMLSVQLIEAPSDKHLWAEQYNREVKDIFNLQSEIARSIADKIEVIITPEEKALIEKPPTDNVVAYDYFLKGQELFHEETIEGMEGSIVYFKKAIEHDSLFARAYADLAIAYYFLDYSKAEKKYADLINNYADKAMSLDPKLSQSLMAKALYFYSIKRIDLGIPYLEKALEYNPNSAIVFTFLADYYANIKPNTEKYLEYAVKAMKIDIGSQDSSAVSYAYLHIGNAFVQSGFIDEAEEYVRKSLKYKADNLYSEYVLAYIQFARNRDLNQLKGKLFVALQKDTTRVDIIQEIGKICYYLRDYDCAYAYYKPFNDIRKLYNPNMYMGENAKIALVYSEAGHKAESEKLLADYLLYAENDNSIYKQLSLAAYYSYKGESKKAIEHLKLFSQQEDYFYWILVFLEIDPLFDNIKGHPEFKKTIKELEVKFLKNQDEVEIRLKEKDLL